jgi:xylulokinase
MSRLTCGIDIGTTNLKVLLLDDEGQTVWVKSVPAPHLNDGLGVVTDARALVVRCEELIIEGWRAEGRGRTIAAIASGGIGEDGVGVDAALQPLGHAIQWNDRRGEVHALALASTEMAKAHPEILLDFSSSAGKWAWLRANRPAELANARNWITMTDYPLAVWSGTAFISATLVPRTGCYDLFAHRWLPDFLSWCGAPPMPPLIEAGHVMGHLRDGTLTAAGAATENTVLVAGGHDHPLAASAIRRIETDARIDSMGTANATYGETATLVPDHPLEGLYATRPISGRGRAGVIGMTEFSLTLDRLSGGVAAHFANLLKTSDINKISSDLRVSLEHLANRTKHYWAAMTRAGVPQAPIFATGGWTRSPALMQLRANIFQEQITVVDEPELVALGAALFAAEGATGRAPLFSAARKSHVVEPR